MGMAILKSHVARTSISSTRLLAWRGLGIENGNDWVAPEATEQSEQVALISPASHVPLLLQLEAAEVQTPLLLQEIGWDLATSVPLHIIVPWYILPFVWPGSSKSNL